MEKGFSCIHGASGRLEQFLRAAREVGASLDARKVLERLMEAAMEDLGAANCSLFQADTEPTGGNSLQLVLSKGPIGETLQPGMRLHDEKTVPGWVFSHAKPLRLQNPAKTAGATPDTLAEPQNVHTVLCLPLVAGGRVQGVAKMANKVDGGEYSQEDEDLFGVVCSFAATAMENGRMHQAILEKAEMDRQLQLAAAIQENLLPAKLPSIPGLDIAAKSRACQSVGGDYYDAFLTSDGGLAVVVGDITGHGLPAALLMTTARAYIRSSLEFVDDPARLLRRVNTLFSWDTYGSGNFMSLFCLRVYPDRRCFAWVNAGHGPMLMYDPPSDSVFEVDKADCPPLGAAESTPMLARERCNCAPGQICAISTDGVWEARSPDGEMYGMDRLKTRLAAHANESAAHIVEAVLDDVKQFRGDRPRSDDETLLVIRVE